MLVLATTDDTMPHDSDTILRNLLGDNLQTGALRAVLLLAAFSLIGAFVAFLVV